MSTYILKEIDLSYLLKYGSLINKKGMSWPCGVAHAIPLHRIKHANQMEVLIEVEEDFHFF